MPQEVLFAAESCAILVPPPGIKPRPAVLQGGFLNTGPPEKTLLFSFKHLEGFFFLRFYVWFGFHAPMYPHFIFGFNVNIL